MKLNLFKEYLIILFGAVIYSLSVVIFTSPNNIAPGGLTGIATMLNYLFKVPIGVFIFIMNIPLLFLSYKKYGRGFLIKTIVGIAFVSVFIDVLTLFIPSYKGNTLLASLFGGILNGTGLALIFTQGGTTGGTDIVATIIHKHYPHISLGAVILGSDVVIILCAAVVYESIESALYAVISIFVSTKVIDTIITGASRNNGKLMLIITSNYLEIQNKLLNEISRGVTVIDGKGGYTGERKKLLICAVRPQQTFKANAIVKSIDSSAFVIITTANTINGAGFANK